MLNKNMPSIITEFGIQPGGKVCLIVVAMSLFFLDR